MGRSRSLRNPLRGGLVVHSVALSVLLVIATALAVGFVIARALNEQIERAADRRLVVGATFFRALLDDTRDDLVAIGDWLARDHALIAAIVQDEPEQIQERLALALRLRAVDGATIARPDGEIVARRSVTGLAEAEAPSVESAALERALTGRASAGLNRAASGPLRLEVYVPLLGPGGEQPIAVLRLASVLQERQLEEFKTRTGLDASLFFGEARVITTLRRQSGAPVSEIGPEPLVYQAVVGDGREVVTWRDLPIGRVRSRSAPLEGPDTARVGMFSVAIPANALIGELEAALLSVLPVTLVITIGGALMAFLLMRGLRAPIVELASAAARLRAGDLDTPIPAAREPALQSLAEALEEARSAIRAHLVALADAEARQRALVAALRDPIITTTADGRVAAANEAAESLLGDVSRLYGRPIRDLLPFVTAPAGRADAMHLWQGQVEDVTGRTVHVEVSLVSFAHRIESPTGVYVVHDISQHAELNRLREELLYSVAHELRGPMSVLDNALEILATEYGDLSAREFDELVASARRTTRRLQALMEDLLSAGSIQSGRFAVALRPMPLDAIVDEALDLAGPLIEGRGQRVERQTSSERLFVVADRRYAPRVLWNLLSNASKYSPERGVIRVRATRADGAVRVAVEDQGPGISAEQQVGLFERFYRVRRSGEEPGVGLGLAIAKGIVEAHGGTMGIESVPGRGTTVWFTLPAAQVRAA